MSKCVEFYRPRLPRSQGQPGQEFKGQMKCDALLLVEKVIFCQSIANDDGAYRALRLYYCLIHFSCGTWVRTKADYFLIQVKSVSFYTE